MELNKSEIKMLCPKISKGLDVNLKNRQVNQNRLEFVKTYGECKFGLNCYFGECHIVDNKTIVNKELVGKVEPIKTLNEVSNEIQIQLKTNNYPFPKSEIYFKENGITVRQIKGRNNNKQQQENDNKRKENEKDEEEEHDKLNKKIKLEMKILQLLIQPLLLLLLQPLQLLQIQQ
ncbi:hypothetical protein ACTFIY_003461 [Dictyostelium cf. discoideum]